jgi:hypothetical protein
LFRFFIALPDFRAPNPGARNPELETRPELRTVIADRFDGTILHCFLAQSFLFRSLWLPENIRVPGRLIPPEYVRRGFPALIAIDALVIHVITAYSVLCVFICNVCHIFSPVILGL